MSFKPGQLWYDTDGHPINAHAGGILYCEGRYYWFGQIMVPGNKGSDAWVGVSCYSSSNLYAWKNEGVAFYVSDDPEHPVTRGCKLERPKVIYNEKTKKFVMWFHLELRGQGFKAALSGVATSDTVTEPYTFEHHFRPVKSHWPLNVSKSMKQNEPDPLAYTYPFRGGEVPKHPNELNLLKRDFSTGQMARDMTLFKDDDGTAYHLYASEENSTLHIAKLSDDYLKHTGEYVRVFPGRFMEAPAVFKRDGTYYLIASGCTSWAPNAARSAVASSMFGEWTELGNPCVGEDADITFDSQSTYVLPVTGEKNAFIFMADRWRPENPIDGRYVWLPIGFEGEKPMLRWLEQWDLNFFDS